MAVGMTPTETSLEFSAPPRVFRRPRLRWTSRTGLEPASPGRQKRCRWTASEVLIAANKVESCKHFWQVVELEVSTGIPELAAESRLVFKRGRRTTVEVNHLVILWPIRSIFGEALLPQIQAQDSLQEVRMVMSVTSAVSQTRSCGMGSVVEVSPKDVLCGKGKAIFEHVGNRRFRVVISMNAEKYKNHMTKSARSVQDAFVYPKTGAKFGTSSNMSPL